MCASENDSLSRRATLPGLIVALDVPLASRALALEERLSGLPVGLKIGLELFTAEGPSLLHALKGRGRFVFLDLKFHDIPNTVYGAVRSASVLNVDMCTLHLSGGEDMCKAAVAGREEALLRARESGAPRPGTPLLMGVTVLTSRSAGPGELADLVVERALLAKRTGLDGVVCSGLEAAAVKNACGGNLLCLCPGIRFPEADAADRGDQARVCTPAEAVRAGADFLVMGRPVTGAADPAAAARKALEQMLAAAAS